MKCNYQKKKGGKELRLRNNWENNINIFLAYKVDGNIWLIANNKELVLFNIFGTPI